jgi:hypothetical protein
MFVTTSGRSGAPKALRTATYSEIFMADLLINIKNMCKKPDEYDGFE